MRHLHCLARVARSSSSSLSSGLLAGALCLAASACGGGDGDGEGSSGESGTGDETTTTTPVPADTSTGPTTEVETTDDPTGVMETTPEPECGNGIVEDPEDCDDGNQMPGDGCDVDCTEVIDTTQWSDVVDGMAGVEESGQGIAIDGEGNVIVVGYIVDVVSAPDIWVRKYDPAGAVVWTVNFDPGMGLDDRGYGIDVDGAGNIAIAGDVGVDASTSDTWVALLDARGALVWSVTADGPQGNNDIAEDVAFDSTGAVWAVGGVRTGANDTDIWVAKYDGTGAEITSDVVPGPAELEDRALGVDVDAEDNAFVAGFVSDEAFARDVWLRKYDSAGAEAWTVTWNSDNDGADAGFDVVVAPDGTIGVAGFTALTAVNEDVWLGRFLNADGAMMWQKRFGGPNILRDQGLGVTADADNNFIVAGFKGVSDVDTDIWVGKWDSPGSEVWIQSFAGAGGDRDEARAIAVDAAGDLAVTGQIRARANNNGDIWVAKLGGVP